MINFLKKKNNFWAYIFVCLLILIILGVINVLRPNKVGFLTLLFLLILVLILVYFEASKPLPPSPIFQDLFQKIIETLEDGVIVYDKDFTINYFNKAAENIFGLKKEDVLGIKITPQHVQDEKIQRLAQVIFPSLSPLFVVRSNPGEELHIAEIFFYEPDLFLRVLTSKIYKSDASPYGFIKIIHDRTKEINLLKSKSEFVTIASHQLRTPVNEIRWGLEAIITDTSLDHQNKEILSKMLESAKRLSNLIEHLLNISKIEEGKFGYEFQKTNLIDFLKKILSEVLPQIRKLNLELYFKLPDEEIPEVYIDNQKMKMAILNLVDNAVKYNVPNGRIIIEAKKSAISDFVEVSIEDTGIGMSKEDLKNLFKKFFRASTALKIDTEGSGLGLYITKNIILAHGGKIWAESEVGRGTKITFSLPTDLKFVPPKEIPIFDYEI